MITWRITVKQIKLHKNGHYLTQQCLVEEVRAALEKAGLDQRKYLATVSG